MQNFFLQVQSTNDETSSITGGLWDIIDKINPLQLPQDAFVTDLAIIMILAGIVTLAFFKIKTAINYWISFCWNANWTTFSIMGTISFRHWNW